MNATATRTGKPKPADFVTEPQVRFIQSLLQQLGQYALEAAQEAKVELNDQYTSRKLTVKRAGGWIDALKAGVAAVKEISAAHTESPEPQAIPASSRPRPDVPSGRYAVETNDGKLAFYTVMNRAGHYTVKLHISDQRKVLNWTSALTVLRKIEDAGIDAAGMRFATETNCCRDCGRELTDPESRATGRGPICAGRA